MKFMKLGSKPDSFQTEANNVRYVASELPTEIVVNVGDVKFYLHKYPLLSKSNRLHKLILRTSADRTNEITFDDLPGGPKAFELCVKFCYGMTFTLNAYNVVSVRCAAGYLEMTEDIERGNLIYKVEVFLTSCVFRAWKDSIIALETTKALLPWSDDLKIVGRCIDYVASQASIDPANVHWSYAYSKKLALSGKIVELEREHTVVPRDWWVEDICDLDVDIYKRVLHAVKAKGRMSHEVIGEALKAYAIRWLPNSTDRLVSDENVKRNRYLIETIVQLLPSKKGSGCSCSFLLKLLKVAILVGIDDSLTEKLLRRIGLQLEKASAKDLLIPARPPDEAAYDVRIVQKLVSIFLMHNDSNQISRHGVKDGNMSDGLVLGHGYLLTVGKLVDGYLAEVACDPNLPLCSFVDLASSLPEAARLVHDGLYAAIDIYIQEHSDLTKAEKKKLCGLMDVSKLSAEACVHAVQNDRLPLRVIVQVLYFEQLRSASQNQKAPSSGMSRGDNYLSVQDDCESLLPEQAKLLNEQLRVSKSKSSKSETGGGRALLLQSRSRRIFDKLWNGNYLQTEKTKQCETSESPHSPPASTAKLRKAKSVGSSRNRRNSVS